MSHHSGTRRRTASLVSLGALGLAALAGASAFGGPRASAAPATVNAISGADREQGRKAHPQLLQEFGGRVASAQAGYVESVGKTIAVQSGLSNAREDFTVTLLNSPVNNAFAIPGGYVYVTRQLVALMNSEAELAGVLGHEVGHVAARHAAKRQSAATRNTVIGALGSILSGVLLGDNVFGQLGQELFSQGSQLLTLKYSRSQEIEADNLGIEYLRRAGYDPRAMSSVLQNLAAQNALEARLMGARDSAPQWASTHPDPASRVRTALARAGSGARGAIHRDRFLAGVAGLTYGDDPAQGIVAGRSFTHPELRLAFQAPEGFYLVNGTRAVSISGQSAKAEFTGASYDGDLDAYVRRAFAALTGSGQRSLAPLEIARTTVNGMPAAYGVARAQASGGPVDVVVFAYEFARDRAYHFVTISQAGRAGAFNPMFGSFRRISATEAQDVKPRKLVVVTVKRGDTPATLAERMAYTDAPLDRFLVLNGLESGARLVQGQKVKLVTY